MQVKMQIETPALRPKTVFAHIPSGVSPPGTFHGQRGLGQWDDGLFCPSSSRRGGGAPGELGVVWEAPAV